MMSFEYDLDALPLEPTFTNFRPSGAVQVSIASPSPLHISAKRNEKEAVADGFVDHSLHSVTDVDLNDVRQRQQSARDLAYAQHAITSVLVSILLRPNLTPLERASALENLRESVTQSLCKLLHVEGGRHLDAPGSSCDRENSDWFESTPPAVKRHFGLLASKACAALGVPPLVYEILRWSTAWEGTDEMGRIVSSGMECIQFFIDVWDEEDHDSESTGLLGIVAHACLQLDDHTNADLLFQKLVPYICSTLGSKSPVETSTTSPWPAPHRLVDYFISSSISPTSLRRRAKGKSKAVHHSHSQLLGSSNGTIFSDPEVTYTSVIGLRRFAATLRDSRNAPERFTDITPKSIFTKSTPSSSALSTIASTTHNVSTNAALNTLSSPTRSRPFGRGRGRLFSPYSPAKNHRSTAAHSSLPIARRARSSPELFVPFLALQRAWLLGVGETSVHLTLLDAPEGISQTEFSASVRVILPSPSDSATASTSLPACLPVELPPLILHSIYGFRPHSVSASLRDSLVSLGPDGVESPPDSSAGSSAIARFDDPRILDEDGTLMLELELRVSSSARQTESTSASDSKPTSKPIPPSIPPPSPIPSSSFLLISKEFDIELDSERATGLDTNSAAFSLVNTGTIPPTGTGTSLSLASHFEVLSWSDSFEHLSAAG